MNITLPTGEQTRTYLALDDKQQKLGLSRVKKDEFGDSDAMLFPNYSYELRQFWMPETHFNLDIFFLSHDLKVLDIHRNMPHYTKSEPKSMIPMSKISYCQHVLEIKSSSPISRRVKIGMTLKSSWSPEKIISSIRLN